MAVLPIMSRFLLFGFGVFCFSIIESFTDADEFDLTHWHKQPHWPGECLSFDGSQPLMFLTLFHDGISHHIINHHKAGRKKEANEAAKRMCMEHCLKFRKWCLAIELVGSHVHPERKLPGCGLVTDAETFFRSGEKLQDHRYTYDCTYDCLQQLWHAGR